MLTFACNSAYHMIPLKFLEEAEELIDKGFINFLDSPNYHLEVGSVVARRGQGIAPEFLQSVVGMLHFGIITKQGPPINSDMQKQSSEFHNLYFEDKRWLRNFYLKKQYFERFHIQHYVKHGTAQVKETSLGVFLFGESAWFKGTWCKAKIPKCFKIRVPNQDVEQLQSKLAKLNATLGERKYSLFSRNCETYCMEIALDDKEMASNMTNVQVFAVFTLLAILVVLSIVIIILFSLKKKKDTKQISKTSRNIIVSV